MKIILEDTKNSEIEIVIKGDILDSKVQHIISLLSESSVSSKIILYDDLTEVLMDISEISYFEVVARKTFAVANNKRYVTRNNLAELLSLFGGYGICQIGKSVIVNINHVKSLEAEFSGNYTIRLKNGEKIIASRFYMKNFRKMVMEG